MLCGRPFALLRAYEHAGGGGNVAERHEEAGGDAFKQAAYGQRTFITAEVLDSVRGCLVGLSLMQQWFQTKARWWRWSQCTCWHVSISAEVDSTTEPSRDTAASDSEPSGDTTAARQFLGLFRFAQLGVSAVACGTSAARTPGLTAHAVHALEAHGCRSFFGVCHGNVGNRR